MSINNNISKFANTVDSSGQIDFADLANKPTTLAGYGITDGASGGSVTSYTNASDLPLSGNSAGDLAYVVETNRMYVNTGSGWYSISLVNTDPSITSVQDADSNSTPFTLSTDGTATVITITASDPEDIPVTYSYSVTSGSLTNGGGTTATVSQGTGANTNVFTITPTTTEDYAGSFTLTFTVSDGVNTSTSANAFSLQFSINNAKYTTLLLKADASSSDNQADASSNSLTITESGNVTSTAFSPYHPKGYSAYFDHTGDYLLHGDGSSSAYITLSGDFTIEAFIFSNGDFSSSQNNVFGSDLTHEGNYQVYVGSSYNLAIYDNSTAYLSTGTVPQDEWAHIAITRSGSTVTYWINGVSAGTSTVSTTLKYRIIGGLIQSSTSTVYNSFKGYISNARIVNGTAIYTSSFTPPTEALTNVTNTELLACHLPYLKDGSSNDYDITITGDVKLQQFGPFDHGAYTKSSYGGSVYFDGSGDYLQVSGSNGEFDITSSFSAEAWFYMTASAGTGADAHSILTHWAGTTDPRPWLIDVSGTSIRVFVNNSSNVQIVNQTTGTVSLNNWHHIAFTWDGSNYRLFLDGNLLTTVASSDAPIASTRPLRIGYNTNNQYFQGYISDVRITIDGGAQYTSDFTPPTEPITAVTNTQLLTCTNKHEIWDAASGERITLNGNVDASTTQYKWGNSVAFDGAGDYLSITSSSDLYDFGTGDFTIEFWMYLNSYTTGDIVADARAVWNDQGWSFEQQNNGIMLYSSGGQRLTTSAINTSTAQWIHVAFARESGTLRSYINGANETSVTYSTAINTTASTIRIGQRQDNGGTQLDGYIEDFRITKGLARYTSTFTAPSSTFAG